MKIAIVILAAGKSRRFGKNKLLYPIEGIPMYKRTLSTFGSIINEFKRQKKSGYEISDFFVVTRFDMVEEACGFYGATAIRNEEPEKGITYSLLLGLLKAEKADACLFAVCDQPWLKKESIMELLDIYAAGGKGIACMSWNGVYGNPCIFSKKYYPELSALTGDVGGKRVLMAHQEDLAVYMLSDRKELEDVDVPLE